MNWGGGLKKLTLCLKYSMKRKQSNEQIRVDRKLFDVRCQQLIKSFCLNGRQVPKIAKKVNGTRLISGPRGSLGANVTGKNIFSNHFFKK